MDMEIIIGIVVVAAVALVAMKKKKSAETATPIESTPGENGVPELNLEAQIKAPEVDAVELGIAAPELVTKDTDGNIRLIEK